MPLSLHLLMKGPERYHMNPTAAIVGHLVCQLPHRLASCCYMHFCVDCSARITMAWYLQCCPILLESNLCKSLQEDDEDPRQVLC